VRISYHNAKLVHVWLPIAPHWLVLTQPELLICCCSQSRGSLCACTYANTTVSLLLPYHCHRYGYVQDTSTPTAPCQECRAPLFSPGAQSTSNPWPPCSACTGTSPLSEPLLAGDVNGKCLSNGNGPAATCTLCLAA
jgi:hypothetical protein